MSLQSRISEFRKALEKELKPTKAKGGQSEFSTVEFSISEVPKIIEKKDKDWVFWGENNLYPLQIGDMIYGSAIHNSIIKTKSKMTAGEGFLINGSPSAEDSETAISKLDKDLQEAYKAFVENKNNKESLHSVTKKLAYDLQLYGAFAYEVIWNQDFTKIVTIKYVKVANLRAGKMVNDQVESYWYSKNWVDTKIKPREIPALKKDHPQKDGVEYSYNEIVYKKLGNLEYYGEPSYIGALTWIQTDFQMGIFHLANIENGMNPSMKLQFYKLPSSENDKQEILDDIRKRFTGPKKTGKHMVFFSDGKELAPSIDPVQTSNLDKQLLLLAELCDRKILTGHQLTSPLLVGISTSGQIGGNTELKVSYQIFDNTVIAFDRDMISDSYQEILDINGTEIKIKINPFDPFRERAVIKTKNNITDAINSLSPLVANKVLESMTVDEIRELIGLAKATGPTSGINTTV